MPEQSSTAGSPGPKLGSRYGAGGGLDLLSPGPSDAKPRDVYLYVISGHKVRNPAAAMALIERLG